MERNIRLLLLLVVLPHPCAPTSILWVTRVVHVSDMSSWWDSQLYCRARYSDLVTIRNEQEANSLVSFDGWIGLYSWPTFVWAWSIGDELPTYLNWEAEEPAIDDFCAYKLQSNPKWYGNRCIVLHPTLCVDKRMVLVREMETWENAMGFCRKLQARINGSHPYQLVSLPESNNVLWGREALAAAAINEVWIGLRFLAGEWLWLSGKTVTSSHLPPCPSEQQRCGALDSSSTRWKTLDCSERRPFLCGFRS